MSITKQHLQEMYKFIYAHLDHVPADSIQRATILVSPSNETIKIIAGITGKMFNNIQERQPKMCSIEGSTLVHPTDALLNAQIKHNFVSMHYLFKTVKMAKFLIVFNHSDFMANGNKAIKQTIKKLLSFFVSQQPKDKVKQIIQNLSASCGIVVMDPMREVNNYLSYFQKMKDDKKFLQTQQALQFTKGLAKAEKFLLYKPQAPKEVARLVGTLREVEVKGRVNFNLESQEKKYKAAADDDKEDRWLQLFKILFKNMNKPAMGSNFDFESLLRQHVLSFQMRVPQHYQSKIQSKRRAGYNHENAREEISLLAYLINSLRLIEMGVAIGGQPQGPGIDKYFNECVRQMVQSDIEAKECYLLVQKMLEAFYVSGYLKTPEIQYLLLSYFEIVRFLRDVFIDERIYRAEFKQAIITKKELINQNMGSIISKVQHLLEQAVINCDNNYPFQQVISLINDLLTFFSGVNPIQYEFWTNRYQKKYHKHRAQLAFKKATFISKQYGGSSNQIIEQWASFLQYSLKSSLIDSSKKQQALIVIADKLAYDKEYQLALKTYNLLPEYQIFKKVIKIYEKDMKIYPEMLRFTLLENWEARVKHIEEYCQFLLRIGFTDRVRQLCLEGLNITCANGSAEGQQLFKKLLIEARSSKGQEFHEEFLEKSILKKKPISINQQLLAKIRNRVDNR